MSPKVRFVRKVLWNLTCKGGEQRKRLGKHGLEAVPVFQIGLLERLPVKAALQAFEKIQDPATVGWFSLTSGIQCVFQEQAVLQLLPGEAVLAGDLNA